MDDLSAKLSEILGDEDSMRRVQELASQLLSKEPTLGEKETNENNDGVDMGRLLSLVSKFKNKGEDDRTRLLLALKPHLSSERAKRVDTAVKLLKIIDLLPLIRETDLFSGLL
jgi:LPS O-antigen subunit length determinant protein (WzzB/FepE family)